MKRKILAVFMAMLMSATVLASFSTVTADDEDWMKEIQDHVTPEQWIEIQKLLKKNEETKSLPDLDIIDFDQGQDEILWAEVWNKGDGYASAFDVYFHVYDSGWQSIGRDIVWLGLASGWTVWTNSQSCPLSGTFNCRAWADMEGDLEETNDDNNQAYGTFSFS